jgi:hypothetical protein
MVNYTQTFLSLVFWLTKFADRWPRGNFWGSLLARIYARMIQNTKFEEKKGVNLLKNGKFI